MCHDLAELIHGINPLQHTPDGPRRGDPAAAEIVAGLTAPQAEAVRHTEGPLLVLAGPGSGKTRVITRRIAYLIHCGIPPWQILALTFTNKAAAEMRERVIHLLGEGAVARADGDNVPRRGAAAEEYTGSIAKLPGLDGNYAIYDTDDQMTLVKWGIQTLDLSNANWQPRSVLSRISNAKNELLDHEAFAGAAGDFYAKTLAKIYTEYQKGLRRRTPWTSTTCCCSPRRC